MDTQRSLNILNVSSHYLSRDLLASIGLFFRAHALLIMQDGIMYCFPILSITSCVFIAQLNLYSLRRIFLGGPHTYHSGTLPNPGA